VAHASSRAEIATVASLTEVGRRGGPGSIICVFANRATRPVKRLRQFAFAAASEQTRTMLVRAGAEFGSERNHICIRTQLGRIARFPPSAERKSGVLAQYAPRCGGHFRDASTGAAL